MTCELSNHAHQHDLRFLKRKMKYPPKALSMTASNPTTPSCQNRTKTESPLDHAGVGAEAEEGVPLGPVADMAEATIGEARQTDRQPEVGCVHHTLQQNHIILNSAYRHRWLCKNITRRRLMY